MNLLLPTGPLAQSIGWALLHLLWQGALVAVLTAGLLALLAGRGAAVRYAVACVALGLIVALGVATAFRSYPAASLATHAVAGSDGSHIRSAAPATSPVAAAPDPLRALVSAANDWLPRIVALWLGGVAVFSVRLILEWLRARRLVTRGAVRARQHWQTAARRLGQALGVRHAVRLLESAAVEVPSLIGLLRPAILLPASTLTGLTPAQLEMILAHELAHIRRHDFLVNLLQAVVETLLFYHPAVWWISRRIRIERENCCDDLAVAVCGNPVQYARALTRLEELRAAAPRVAVAANGGSLLDRIRRLAGGSTSATGPAVRGAAALVVLSCVLLAFAAPTFPAIGQWEPMMKRDRDRAWEHYQAQADRTAERESRRVADRTSGVAAARATRGSAQATDGWVVTAAARDDGDAGGERRTDGRLSIDDLILLRTSDVTAADVRAMRELFPGASAREIASMSAVGATPEFVRQLRGAGLEVSSADEAQGLAAVGVTPEFIRDMRAAGVPVESANDAQSLAATGVTPEFVRGMREAGVPVKSADEAQGLAAVGVTPEYVRALRAAGVQITDADEAQSLKALDITPEFVKRLADAGYKNLTSDELTRLGASGVTGDFIREMSQYRSR